MQREAVKKIEFKERYHSLVKPLTPGFIMLECQAQIFWLPLHETIQVSFICHLPHKDNISIRMIKRITADTAATSDIGYFKEYVFISLRNFKYYTRLSLHEYF